MITWLVSAASASDEISVEWARPFTLATPEPWHWRSDRPLVREGVILQLRVDPAKLVPLQTAEPVLYVGEWPAMRFNWDWNGGCAVVVVPGRLEPSTRLTWGAPELPERITPEAARATSARAAAPDGARIAAALAAGGAPLSAAGFSDVAAVVMERVGACSTAPEDRSRAP
ncbi:MAG: hypothetical protein ABMA64_23685 [Myxococcota bacterium]